MISLRRCRLPPRCSPARCRRGGTASPSGTFSSSAASVVPPNTDEHYDVLVAGGGAVGSLLARLLLRPTDDGGRRRPLRIGVLERRPSPPSLDDLLRGVRVGEHNPSSSSDASSSPPPPALPASFPHPRAYALSPRSLSLLGRSALRRLSESDRLGVYERMQVWESDGPAALHFVGEDLSDAVGEGRLPDLESIIGKKGGDQSRPWLGAVVEDAPLVSALWDELRDDARVDLLDGAEIVKINAPDRPHGNVGSGGGRQSEDGGGTTPFDRDPDLRARMSPPPPVEVTFRRRGDDDDGPALRTATADLLVAADGADSRVRRALGIPSSSHGYGRAAITFTVRLRGGRDMGRTAFQRFLEHGPIALLPVRNGGEGGNGNGTATYANVVWSTTPAEAQRLLALADDEGSGGGAGCALADELNEALRRGPAVNPPLFGDEPAGDGGGFSGLLPSPLLTLAREADALLRTANGGITMGGWTESPSRNHFRMPPEISEIVGPKFRFDLSLSHARSYVAPRAALVGDAAHTVHPMAGQGLNLGFEDASALASLVTEAIDSGMDAGGTMLFLDRYDSERKIGAAAVLGGVHALHGAFAGKGYPGGAARVTARSLGVNVVNALGPVRRVLAEAAAGADPPKGLDFFGRGGGGGVRS